MVRQLIETQMAVIATKVEAIDRTVTDIKQKMENDYVTKEEFDPIKKIVYLTTSLILTSVVGALIALVVKGGI